VRVYYEDTDAQGVVYYANYLRYFERARTEWLRALGVSQEAMLRESGLQFVVRRASMDFIAPARLDDVLQISVRIVKLARAHVQLAQEAACHGRLLCRGDVSVVCLSRDGFRPAPMPAFVAAMMKS
jgi:acyl-CoA thioester hydrolase